MSKYVKKLGSDQTYKRPKVTQQEKLSAEEIANKLEGYEKVDDIAEVPLNTHIRYFTINPDGTQIFRTGGFLHNKQNADTYVMLSNGKNIWSVQVKNSIFFRKMSQKDEITAIHSMYKKKLEEKDEIIEKLKKYIKLKMGNYDSNILANNAQKINPRTSTQPKPQNRQRTESQNRPQTNFQNRPQTNFQNRPQTNFQNKPQIEPQKRPSNKPQNKPSNQSGSKYVQSQSISQKNKEHQNRNNNRTTFTKQNGPKYINSGSKTSRSSTGSKK
jgi:hypothetical protein